MYDVYELIEHDIRDIEDSFCYLKHNGFYLLDWCHKRRDSNIKLVCYDDSKDEGCSDAVLIKSFNTLEEFQAWFTKKYFEEIL